MAEHIALTESKDITKGMEQPYRFCQPRDVLDKVNLLHQDLMLKIFISTLNRHMPIKLISTFIAHPVDYP
jgi:hypothetical protein